MIDRQPAAALNARLGSRIGALSEDLRKLPASVTILDLANRFIGHLRDILPGMSAELFHRPDGRREWDAPGVGSDERVERLILLTGGMAPPSSAVIHDGGGVWVIQKLSDLSLLAVFLQPAAGGRDIPDADLAICCTCVQVFAGAYQDVRNRREQKSLLFSLNQRILQLNSLIDTGIEIAKLDQHEFPHHLALIRAVSMANAARGIVRVREGRKIKQEFIFPDGAAIGRTEADERRISSSFKFLNRVYAFELFDKESRNGIEAFEETDRLLLDALARQVHASLENRYLHEQALEKERIERDMAVAASIQQKILPVALPAIEGYDLAGVNIPSKSVGGDYYNCIPLRDGRYAMVVADVTGKGVPAALLVSSVHAYLAAFLDGSPEIAALAGKLNKVLFQDTTDDKFVTAFIALLAPQTGEIECVSAGHNPAYVLRGDNIVQEVNAGGPPLAMLGMEVPYQSERITLNRGERFLLYTDGVTEAQNEQREMYDTANPLNAFFARHQPERPEIFIGDLVKDIRRFTKSAPQSDDITVMCLRRR